MTNHWWERVCRYRKWISDAIKTDLYSNEEKKKRKKKNLNSARLYCSPEDIVAIKDNANESNVNDAAENFIDEDREKDLLEKSSKKVVKKWSLMCTVQLCMNRNVSNQSVEVFCIQ